MDLTESVVHLIDDIALSKPYQRPGKAVKIQGCTLQIMHVLIQERSLPLHLSPQSRSTSLTTAKRQRGRREGQK